MQSTSRTQKRPGQPTNVRWTIVALACATSWFLYLHRYTFNFIAPELQEEFGFSNVDLSLIYTAFTASYLLGQIPSGVICDFFGPHFFLACIIVVWSIALPGVGTTGNLWGLSACRFGFGAAQAGCYPSLAKVSRIWFPISIRTSLQGLVASFFGRSGGAMSSMIMASLLMGVMGLSWRLALVVMGAAGILFALLFLLLYRNWPDADKRVNKAELMLINEGSEQAKVPDGPSVLPARRVLQNRSMLVFIVQQMLNAGADNIYVYLTGSYFLTKGDLTTAGLLASLPLWGGAVGGLFGGVLNDSLIKITGSRRWGRSIVGFSGKFMACLVMFVAINMSTALAIGLCLFVVKFFSDWTQPTVWGTCTDMGGRYSATVFSVINTSGGIGGAITPLAFGVVLDYNTTRQIINGVEESVTNYTPILVIVAVMYLLAAILWFFINCTDSLDRERVASKA